jgi:ubiquinone biosynthesis protein COQ9
MVSAASDLSDKILDAALAIADARSWESVRLYEVAAHAGVSLEQVRQHFRDKEDLVAAWFDRADSAMLQKAASLEWEPVSPRERLRQIIMAWLDALVPHRRTTREMILGQLEPGHVHIQLRGLMRISRTVQWVREAAHCDATYLRRAVEETVLTTISMS